MAINEGEEEAADDNKKLDVIFSHINSSEILSGDHKIISFPLREGSNTHSLKIQLPSNDLVKRVMSSDKELNNFTKAKIYINYDEPYHTRKENNRLRKKKSFLLRAHQNDEIKINKGKLYHNDMIVDQFDLSNQIF